MSTVAVRAAIKSAIQAAVAPVPVLNALGVRTDLESLSGGWVALGFESGRETRLSIGNPSLWQEIGTVYVVVSVSSGAGDGVLNGRCDLIAEAMRNYQNHGLGLRIVSVDLGASLQEDSDGRWISRTVMLGYERTFYG